MSSRLAAALLVFIVAAPVASAADEASQAATVHLYRESRVVARIYRAPIRLDGDPLLDLANGAVWTAKLAPGTYTFTANDRDVFSDKDKNASSIKVDLQAGQTVYVRASLVMGGRKPNTTLTIVPEDEGSKAIARLKPVRPADVKHPAYKTPE